MLVYQTTENERRLQSFSENQQEQTRPVCRWTGESRGASSHKLEWWIRFNIFQCNKGSPCHLLLSGAFNCWEEARGSSWHGHWRRSHSDHQRLLPSHLWESKHFICFSKNISSGNCQKHLSVFLYYIPSSSTSDPTWRCWWQAPTLWQSSEMPSVASATCKCVGSSATHLT